MARAPAYLLKEGAFSRPLKIYPFTSGVPFHSTNKSSTYSDIVSIDVWNFKEKLLRKDFVASEFGPLQISNQHSALKFQQFSSYFFAINVEEDFLLYLLLLMLLTSDRGEIFVQKYSRKLYRYQLLFFGVDSMTWLRP